MSDTPKTRHRPIVPFDYGTLREDSPTFYSDNKVFEGFKSVRIKKSVMGLAGSFSLVVTDKWQVDKDDFSLRPQARLHGHIGREATFEGYVDRYAVNITSGSRNITIEGRDRTADLVDCSIMGPTEYNNLGLLQIATQICLPFDIKVLNPYGVDLGAPFDKFTIRQGESPFEAITRAAKQREIILLTSTHGNLVLDKRATRRTGTELVEGINIIMTGAVFDHTDRFSEYHVKGQMPGIIADLIESTQTKAVAYDNGVTRYRPTLILSEQSSDNSAAQNRANYEAAYKSAKSFSCTGTVVGWKKKNGLLWVPNEVVPLKALSIGINSDLLIASVTYKLDDSGRSVDLELINKDAFKFEKIKAKSGDVLSTLGWDA